VTNEESVVKLIEQTLASPSLTDRRCLCWKLHFDFGVPA